LSIQYTKLNKNHLCGLDAGFRSLYIYVGKAGFSTATFKKTELILSALNYIPSAVCWHY